MANYPPPYQPAPLQNSNTAIISLIAGITGLTVFPIIGSIIAVILGHMAKAEIRRSADAGRRRRAPRPVVGYRWPYYWHLGFGLFFLCRSGANVLARHTPRLLPLLQLVG